MSSQTLFDSLLPGTPFRGLILRGISFAAYVGVPTDHCLADMDSLKFKCHRGITFRGPGDGIRPEGWYWYGWDYMHAGDAFDMPGLDLLPPEAQSLFLSGSFGKGRQWTLGEVEQDLIDAAVELMEQLSVAQRVTDSAMWVKNA